MRRNPILLTLCILLASCTNYKSEVIYKDRVSNDYAELFSLIDSGLYYRLDIYSPWQGGDDVVISYFLANNIEEIPAGVDPAKKIKIPLTSCVCLSTSHIAMVSACGLAESILGVSGTSYVSDGLVKTRIGKGLVKDVGFDSNLNTELITALRPDIVFVYGIGAESAGYISVLETIGIPALYICDYLELHPLARAEWIKLFGLLYDVEERTDSIFSAVSSEYELITDSISEMERSRPRVMLGLPFKDKWFISPGNSYISQLIKDAGGDYIWNDYISSESMPLGIESVFREALDSDYWLNIGNIQTKDELLAFDRRFEELPPVVHNRLYNNTKRLNSEGGNDYWESGAIYPNLLLKDIASILQPEIIDNHILQYYLKVE